MNLGPISLLCIVLGIIGGIFLLIIGVAKILQFYKNKFNYNVFPATFCLLALLILLGIASEQSGGLQILLIIIALLLAAYTIYVDIKRTNIYYGITAFFIQFVMVFSLIFLLMIWVFKRASNSMKRNFRL